VPQALATAGEERLVSRCTHDVRREGRKGDATRLLEVDDVLDALDAVLEDVVVLRLAHVLVLLGDGEEHEDGLYGLLDEGEELGVEAPDVGEAVAVGAGRVEAEGCAPSVEAVWVAVWRDEGERVGRAGGKRGTRTRRGRTSRAGASAGRPSWPLVRLGGCRESRARQSRGWPRARGRDDSERERTTSSSLSSSLPSTRSSLCTMATNIFGHEVRTLSPSPGAAPCRRRRLPAHRTLPLTLALGVSRPQATQERAENVSPLSPPLISTSQPPAILPHALSSSIASTRRDPRPLSRLAFTLLESALRAAQPCRVWSLARRTVSGQAQELG